MKKDMFITMVAAVPAALIVMLAMAGCDTIQAPPSPRGDPLEGNYPANVAIQGLAEELVVEKPIITASSPDVPMSVVVPVRSVSDDKLKLQYRFIFLDNRGRPLTQPPGWQYITVEPKLRIFMEGSALDTSAADYNLEIRPNRGG